MAKKRLDRFIPTAIPLDDALVSVRVRRFTEAELLEERRLRDALAKPAGDAAPPDLKTVLARALENAKRMIRAYVVIDSGELEDDTGQPITTGAQLLEALPGREDLIHGLVQLVWAENELSPGQREDFRRAVGSALGWAAWIGGPSGAAPDPTAGSVRPPDSSASAAAPSLEAPSADGSSGATDRSTSAAVPSAA